MKKILFVLSICLFMLNLLANIGFTETKKNELGIEQVNKNLKKINSFIEKQEQNNIQITEDVNKINSFIKKQEQNNIQITEDVNKINVNIETNHIMLNSFNEKINIYDKRMDEHNSFISHTISILSLIVAILGIILSIFVSKGNSSYKKAIIDYEKATSLQKQAKSACEDALWQIQNTKKQIQSDTKGFHSDVEEEKQQIKFIAAQVKKSIEEDNEKERRADQKYREAQNYYYKKEKEYDNALLKIKEAIDLLKKPDFYIFKIRIEQELYDMTQDPNILTEIQTTLDKAIKLYPDNAHIYYQYSLFLIWCKQNSDNFKDALKLVEEAIKIDSNKYYFYALKARINTLLEDIKSAKENYKKALDVSKNNSIDTILDYMELLIANNEIAETEEYINLPIYINTNNFGKKYIEALFEAVKIDKNSGKFQILKDRLSKEKEWLNWSTMECKKIINNINNGLRTEQRNAIINILNEIDKYKEEYRKKQIK